MTLKRNLFFLLLVPCCTLMSDRALRQALFRSSPFGTGLKNKAKQRQFYMTPTHVLICRGAAYDYRLMCRIHMNPDCILI